MVDYSITNNYFNKYHKNGCHPVFSGTQSLPQINTDLDNPIARNSVDTVSLSGKTENQKSLNKGLLILGGIATAFVGTALAVKGYKSYQINKGLKNIEQKFLKLQENIPEVQKTFNDVFLRNDISEKEALEMLNRYKEVEKIGVTGSKQEYMQAVFEEAKRNFGFENANFNLKIVSGEVSKNGRTAGGAALVCNRIEIDPQSKIEDIQGIMHHEMRHMKQHYYSVNYDPQRYKYSFAKDIQQGDMSKADYEEVLDSILDDIKEVFNLKSFSKDNIPKDLEQYAKQCLEGEENYMDAHKDYDTYYNNFVEVDARHAGGLIDKLFQGEVSSLNK